MSVVGTSYCGYDKEQNKYKNFYPNEISVRMCGSTNNEVCFVELIEVPEEEAEFWGWYSNERNDCRYIYDNQIAVKMCDMYFFEEEIANGVGRIVPLKIKVIENT